MCTKKGKNTVLEGLVDEIQRWVKIRKNVGNYTNFGKCIEVNIFKIL